MKLSIIIPVFNEEKTISKILSKIKQTKLQKNLIKEIIVIDDGSSDQTSEILKKDEGSFRYFRHNKNLGKGAAVKTGLQKATGEILIIQDADLEYNPEDYSKLVTPILEGLAEVVYGTRLKNYPLNLWGNKKTVLPIHLIANRLLTMLTNILYGGHLTDMETGYKIFRREILNHIKIRSNKFDFEPEITAKVLKQGVKILEIPIKTMPRTYNEGKKIGWRDGVVAIWTLIKYRFTD